MELYNHNKTTYERALVNLREHKECAIIQATGTGKTFITMALLDSIFKDMSVLYVVPTLSIAQSIELNDDWNYSNVTFETYANLVNVSDTYSVVVFDELHRSGARTWLPQVTRIKRNVKYSLGLSATPWRFLDNKRNMAEELFGSCVVYGPDIEEAINSGILIGFDYIAILSEVTEYVDLIENYNPSLEIRARLSGLNLSEYNLAQRIQSNIDEQTRKWVVFYADTDSLEQGDTDIKNWLGDVPIYQLTSRQTQKVNKENLSAFNTTCGTCVIKAVDMLNEGVHLDGVTGIIFARKTVSGNVFLQQLGRALSASNKTVRPKIIDLVENYNNIKVLKAGIPHSRTVGQGFGKKEENVLNITQVLISYDDVFLELEDILAKVTDKWTDWEDIVLREYYLTEGLEVYRRLSDKTKSDCSKRAKLLGLTRNATWTKEEDDVVKKYYVHEKNTIWKRLPGRTQSAIDSRAYKLGVIAKWTADEDLLLMKEWAKEGLSLLQKLPRHDLTDIYERAGKLGLR